MQDGWILSARRYLLGRGHADALKTRILEGLEQDDGNGIEQTGTKDMAFDFKKPT